MSLHMLPSEQAVLSHYFWKAQIEWHEDVSFQVRWVQSHLL